MKKVITLTLTVLFVFALSSVALAAGWHTIIENGDAGNNGTWNYDTTPHTGLTTSSNQCKVCHATHEGKSDGAGFKLLHDTTRATECEYCHVGTSGKANAKAYDVSGTVLGEHRRGDASKGDNIPGSSTEVQSGYANQDIVANGLSCGNCHSVHAANIVLNTSNKTWSTYILKRDPAGNGNNVNDGIQSVADVDGKPVVLGNPTGPPTDAEIEAAFCGDCHNKNVNWDRGGSSTNQGERPTGFAHVLGNVDGLVNIYGEVKDVLDLNDGKVDNPDNVKALTCSSCHRAKDKTGDDFPHQSKSQKFLTMYKRVTGASNDTLVNYTDAVDSSQDQTDPYRTLKNLDKKVCRTCHAEIGQQNNVESF